MPELVEAPSASCTFVQNASLVIARLNGSKDFWLAPACARRSDAGYAAHSTASRMPSAASEGCGSPVLHGPPDVLVLREKELRWPARYFTLARYGPGAQHELLLFRRPVKGTRGKAFQVAAIESTAAGGLNFTAASTAFVGSSSVAEKHDKRRDNLSTVFTLESQLPYHAWGFEHNLAGPVALSFDESGADLGDVAMFGSSSRCYWSVRTGHASTAPKTGIYVLTGRRTQPVLSSTRVNGSSHGDVGASRSTVLPWRVLWRSC